MVGMRGGSIHGDRPIRSWKPEYPIDELTVFIMLNLIRGRAQTQPF